MTDHKEDAPRENSPAPTVPGGTDPVDWKTRYRESAEAYRETRDKLNVRIATLKSQQTVLRDRNKALIEHRDTFKARNARLKDQQVRLRQQVSALAEAVKATRNTTDGTHSESEASESAVQMLHERIADSRRQLVEARQLSSMLLMAIREQGGSIDIVSETVELPSTCVAESDHEAVPQLRTQLSEERERANARQQTLKDRLQTARDLAESRRLTVAEELKSRRQAERVREQALGEVAQLRERLATVDSELNDTKTKLEQQLETVHSDLAKTRATLTSQRKSHSEATALLTASNSEKIQGLQQKIESLQTTLGDVRQSARDQVETLQAQVGTMRNSLSVEKQEAQKLRQKIAAYAESETELEEIRAVNEGLRSQSKLKQEALQDAREAHERRAAVLRTKLEESRAALTAQVENLRKSHAESNDDKEALATLRRQLEKAQQSHSAVAAEFETKLTTKNTQLARVRSNLEASQTQVDELKTKLNDAREHAKDTIAELRRQLQEEQTSRAEVEVLQAELEQSKAKIAELEEYNADQKQTSKVQAREHENAVQLLREKLTVASEDANDSRSKLHISQEQNAELVEKLRSATSTIDDYKNTDEELREAKNFAEQRFSELQSTISEREQAYEVIEGMRAQDELKRQALEEARANFEHELVTTKDKLDAVCAERDQSNVLLRDLRQDIHESDETDNRSEDLAAQLEDAQQELSPLHQQLDNEHKQAENLRAEFKTKLQVAKNEHKSTLKKTRDDFNVKLQSVRDDHNSSLQSLREKLAEVRQDRNDRVKELQSALQETKRQLGTIDRRDIDPREHNTAEAMDSFFAEDAEVERYEEFGESLQAVLKSHRVTLNKKKVMDAGVGPGYALAEMLKRYRPKAVHGLDYSAVAIEKCNELMPQGYFTVGSLYDPLPEQYDVVLCTEVLEHLDEPGTAVRRILEALVPGGTAIFTVPDGRIDVSRLHLNFWSPESWERFMRHEAHGHRVSADSFQARKSSRYRNNLAVVRKPMQQNTEKNAKKGAVKS